jgi:hypothetical protein
MSYSLGQERGYVAPPSDRGYIAPPIDEHIEMPPMVVTARPSGATKPSPPKAVSAGIGLHVLLALAAAAAVGYYYYVQRR